MYLGIVLLICGLFSVIAHNRPSEFCTIFFSSTDSPPGAPIFSAEPGSPFEKFCQSSNQEIWEIENLEASGTIRFNCKHGI